FIKESPAPKSGKCLCHRLPVEPRSLTRGSTFEPFHNSLLITFGLQSTYKPSAGVREPLVIKIYRILCGEHYAKTKGAALLEQSQQRELRRGVRDRREITENLVHVQNRPQARRSRL